MLGAIALALFTSACASTGATPKPFPMPGGTAQAPPAPPDRSAAKMPSDRAAGTIVDTALTFRGVPYRNGGSTPSSGFDCSGFTQFVYARHGLTLPREVHDQFRMGRAVPRGRQQPGDLIFFTTVAPGASHVGISLGDDEFVHAPSSRGVVRVERMTSSYWARRVVGIRRMAR